MTLMGLMARLKLHRLRRRFSPRPAFRRSLHARLVAEAGFSSRLVSPLERGTTGGLRRVAIGACSFALLVSGAGAYAYESPDVIDGHPLYAMKQGLETAEAAIAKTSPERAAAFHEKMLERRLKEAERIVNGRREKLIERAADERERYESERERVSLPDGQKPRLGPEIRDLVERVRQGEGTREEKRHRFKEEARKLIEKHRGEKPDRNDDNSREED